MAGEPKKPKFIRPSWWSGEDPEYVRETPAEDDLYHTIKRVARLEARVSGACIRGNDQVKELSERIEKLEELIA
jgi:hypothetical protein